MAQQSSSFQLVKNFETIGDLWLNRKELLQKHIDEKQKYNLPVAYDFGQIYIHNILIMNTLRLFAVIRSDTQDFALEIDGAYILSLGKSYVSWITAHKAEDIGIGVKVFYPNGLLESSTPEFAKGVNDTFTVMVKEVVEWFNHQAKIFNKPIILGQAENNLELARNYFDHGSRYIVDDTITAITFLSRAIELNPQFVEAYNNRAIAYYEIGNWDAAIADSNSALQLSPNLDTAFLHRAEARLAKGDAKGAISDATQTIQIDPKYVAAYGIRGIARIITNDLDRGIRDCNVVLIDAEKVQVNNLNMRLVRLIANVYIARGKAYQHKGNIEEAISDFKKALNLNPNLPIAPETRSFIELQVNNKKTKNSLSNGFHDGYTEEDYARDQWEEYEHQNDWMDAFPDDTDFEEI